MPGFTTSSTNVNCTRRGCIVEDQIAYCTRQKRTGQVRLCGVPANKVFDIIILCTGTFQTNNILDKIRLCIAQDKNILDKFIFFTVQAYITLKQLLNALSKTASYLIRENKINAQPTIYSVGSDCVLHNLKPYRRRLDKVVSYPIAYSILYCIPFKQNTNSIQSFVIFYIEQTR